MSTTRTGLALVTAALFGVSGAGSVTAETVDWYGGTNGMGTTNPGDVWDFESGTLEGWTSWDRTTRVEEAPVYIGPFVEDPPFRRRASGDFIPAVATINGDWSMVAGVSDSEISARYAGLSGYGNEWNVETSKSFWYGGSGNVTVSFVYYADTEAGADVVTLLLYLPDGSVETIAEFSGIVGSPAAPATEVLMIPEAELLGWSEFALGLRFTSDPTGSDAWEGYCDDIAGFPEQGAEIAAFAFDDFDVDQDGTANDTFDDFESGTGGWTWRYVNPVGYLASVASLADLDPTGPCDLSGDVLFAADNSLLYPPPPPHPDGQHEILSSNPTFVTGEVFDYVRIQLDVWESGLADANVSYEIGLTHYPWANPSSAYVAWSSDPQWSEPFHIDGDRCRNDLEIDFPSRFYGVSPESLRVLVRVRAAPGDNEHLATTAPYFDNVRLGLVTATGPTDAHWVPADWEMPITQDWNDPGNWSPAAVPDAVLADVYNESNVPSTCLVDALPSSQPIDVRVRTRSCPQTLRLTGGAALIVDNAVSLNAGTALEIDDGSIVAGSSFTAIDADVTAALGTFGGGSVDLQGDVVISLDAASTMVADDLVASGHNAISGAGGAMTAVDVAGSIAQWTGCLNVDSAGLRVGGDVRVSNFGDSTLRLLGDTSIELTSASGGACPTSGGVLDNCGLTVVAPGAAVTVDGDVTSSGTTRVLGSMTIDGTLCVVGPDGRYTHTGTDPGCTLRSTDTPSTTTDRVFADAASTLQLGATSWTNRGAWSIAIDDPSRIDLRDADIRFDDGLAPTYWQEAIEVVSEDRGAAVSLSDSSLVVIGSLTVAAGDSIWFTDEHPNASADGSRDALYVEFLVLEDGAAIDVRGQALYYGSLTLGDGAGIFDSVGSGTFDPIDTSSCACAAGWSSLPSSPSPRSSHGAVYVASSGTMLLFGGTDGTNRFNDTWLFDGVSWTELDPPTRPTPRSRVMMVYDSARDIVVMHGGISDEVSILDETWEWDGVTWTFVATGEPARNGAMAYDPVAQVTVLYGGDTIGGHSQTTSEFDGTSWSVVTTSSPPGLRTRHRMTHLASTGLLHMFGGVLPGGTRTNANWTYDATTDTWTDLGDGGPSPRGNHAMTTNTDCDAIYLYGGADNASTFGDTWQFDGATWTEVDIDGGPLPVSHATLTFDETRGSLHLFGGRDGAIRPDQSSRFGCFVVDVGDGSAPSPAAVQLAARPNPFHSGTAVSFDLQAPETVRLDIFDVSGRRIRQLVGSRRFSAGAHELRWDGLDDAGRTVAAGVYFARLLTSTTTDMHRLVRVR